MLPDRRQRFDDLTIQRFNVLTFAWLSRAKRKWSVANRPSGYFRPGKQSAEFHHENNPPEIYSIRTHKSHLRIVPLPHGRVLRTVCRVTAAVHYNGPSLAGGDEQSRK
jgi:hypothetical protein